ncbi:MAG TPA: sugar diacid recognition domain-containing protein [Atribacterota bacterium]|nr:sugar diacid recognition domain-containing protein [Atribacterota bacterium]
MEITHELAQQIVDKTINIIGKNINIMNEKGIIIGTGDKSRLNQYHEGAALVLKNRKKMFIHAENETNLVGVKPGINLPIENGHEIIGVVGITGNPDEVGPLGEIIKTTVEIMLQQQFLLKEIDLERQAKDNFIHDLFFGRVGPDKDLFIARGNVVGYDITIPRVVLLVNINYFEKTIHKSNNRNDYNKLKEEEIYLQRLKEDLLRILQDFFANQPKEILAYMGGDNFVILKTINTNEKPEITREKLIKVSREIKRIILKQKKFTASVGIGEYHPGIKGLKHSYQEACRAIEIGERVDSKSGVHHIAYLGIYRICAETNPEIRDNYIQNILKDNNYDKRKELKAYFWETLQTFFEKNLNITDTAKSIFIHRNTLLYRLERIRQVTGLDPRKFNEALQLDIALKMKHFQGK